MILPPFGSATGHKLLIPVVDATVRGTPLHSSEESHRCHQNVVTQLRSYFDQRVNNAHKWSWIRSMKGCRNPVSYIGVTQYYSPGNRRVHALGDPQNGIGISGTRLHSSDHKTVNRLLKITDSTDYQQTQLYDNVQWYIYAVQYGSWDIQK